MFKRNEDAMQHLDAIVSQAKAAIAATDDMAALDAIRVEFLGKKGLLTLQMQTL